MVILKKRGVRMVLGRGHAAAGTNALLYVSAALEFNAL
jgi:hypothetical protein